MMTQESLDALKPCPFCGCGALLLTSAKTGHYWGECGSTMCAAEAATTTDKATAIAAWNNRTPDLTTAAECVPALEAENARLREALQPFSDACEKADRSAADRLHLGMGVMSDTASPGWGVKYGHLKAARAALGDPA